MEVTITEYHDFYSEWWGLKDGTILPIKDESGSYWVKVDGETKEEIAPWLR